MTRVFYLFLLSQIVLGTFPIRKLTECKISDATVNAVKGMVDEHQKLIELAKIDKTAKKTEIQSLMAEIDFYLEEKAPESDQNKWKDCVET